MNQSDNPSTYFETNKALWDARTALHINAELYDLPGFMSGKTSLRKIELAALKDQVAGKSLLHLQCHFGLDTLSWGRLGAQATGVDFSTAAIEQARKISQQIKQPATFVESNVYDLKDNLSGQFDLVYTSYGVLGWLPDLDRWASIVSHFLKPGGTFYIAEFHPVIYLFDFPTEELAYPYFNPGKPFEEDHNSTYTDQTFEKPLKEFFWCHSMSDVISALLNHGLEIQTFKEFPFSPYNCFENMVQVAEEQFVYRGPNITLPHVYSITCKKRS